MRGVFFALSVVLAAGPVGSVEAFQEGVSIGQQEEAYTVLTDQEMANLVGGMTVGQITIYEPSNDADVSGYGRVNYRVGYQDVDGSAVFVIFAGDSDGNMYELDRRDVPLGAGSLAGGFYSSSIPGSNNVIVAEIIQPGGDPYDACQDGTNTVYARGMRHLYGNGN